MAEAEGWIRTAQENDRLIIAAGGRWVLATSAELDRRLRAVSPGSASSIVIDLAEVVALDTAGAWLVLRTQQALAAGGRRSVGLENIGARYLPLMHQVEESGGRRQHLLPPSYYRFGDFTARIGRITIGLVKRGGELLGFVGLIAIIAFRALRHPSRIRFTSLINHMEQTGVDALPIVGLLSFLIGVVMAFQGADQLRRFGAEIYTVNLLGVAILRELGVLLAAIIIAGRSGSAFTAQIGTMKVNEEVDALQVLGMDPVEVLVLPRLMALLLTMPLIAFYSNIMALAGGALMAWATLDIPFSVFLQQLQGAISGWTFWLGVLKAPFFAGIIALTGCYEGLRVARSAESVGRQTTRSVVESIFLIIVADALFSILFSRLGI
ncbi:MAG: putative transporter, permease protein [Rhodospirillales bacterium]|jgi:phospholipid/cholesterol/gamma-HCH transport system permease protein|nr:putative transporter, permease protein [Rhodospirillales bacterium]